MPNVSLTRTISVNTSFLFKDCSDFPSEYSDGYDFICETGVYRHGLRIHVSMSGDQGKFYLVRAGFISLHGCIVENCKMSLSCCIYVTFCTNVI